MASQTTPGRRVENIGELEQPGDYCPCFTEAGELRCLWFKLPEGTQGRIAAEGHEEFQTAGQLEPGWRITVEDDGSVTVSPSIHLPGIWHGFLERGVWRGA